MREEMEMGPAWAVITPGPFVSGERARWGAVDVVRFISSLGSASLKFWFLITTFSRTNFSG